MLNGDLDYMHHHCIKPMAWNPLGSIYREETPQTIRLRNLLNTLALKYNVSEDILALKWIMRHPAHITPVIGTASMERISLLQQLSTFELELEDWFAIWVESQGNKVP